ncbi:hypothetical protein C8F01DRAFT_1342905 [Mycena amicta]|nr:hypothetical protein C8F01DRAFT_1342905 [Mycena amicta]
MPYRALWVVLPCLAAAFEQQQVFDVQWPYGPGILRRFSPGSRDRLQDVLGLAQTQDLVHAGDQPYVDVYTPPLAAFLPSSLLDVPHTASNVTPTPTTPRSPLQEEEDWDLETLQNTTFHDEYHPQSDVDAFMRRLAELHPESMSLLELGHTAEGREMLGLRVSKPSNATKVGFVVMGPQHAREWVATATALYFAHALLVNASEPNSLASLLEVYDFMWI